MVDIRDLGFRADLISKVSKQADAAELFWVTKQSTPVNFEANNLKEIQSRETSGIALRVIKDGKIGFSSTTNLDDLNVLIENALSISSFGPAAKLEFPRKMSYRSLEVFDSQISQVSTEDLASYGQSLIDGAINYWPEVSWDATVSKTEVTIGLMNTNGCIGEYKKSIFGMSLNGELIRGTDMLFVWDGYSSCKVESLIDGVVTSVSEQLELATNTVPAPVGNLPVLFTPEAVASVLLSPILAGLNGKSVLQGSSPLINKLGEKIVDARFSLTDDPLIGMASGSRIFDDEGVASKKVPLLVKGVVTNFLYDLQTAALANVDTTASAERSLGTPPSPGSAMLVVDEGDTPKDEIIKSIDNGLLVHGLLGAGQGNMLGGDFKANILLGYKIERGEIVGRVKDTMISGNTYTALNNLIDISDKAEWVGGSLLTPFICCGGISVASSK